MRSVLIGMLITFAPFTTIGQIAGIDTSRAQNFVRHLSNNVINKTELIGGAQFINTRDSLYAGQHFITALGDTHTVMLDYAPRGEGQLHVVHDFKDITFLEHRSRGTGNWHDLLYVHKNNPDVKNWLGHSFLYGNDSTETAIYISNDQELCLHDFKTDQRKHYHLPKSNCICCGCWAIPQVTNDYIIIDYVWSRNETCRDTIRR